MDADTNRRCNSLETALARAIGDSRLIVYLQRHEFEALVLASLPSLRGVLDAPDDLAGLDALEAEIAGRAPEDVDDGVNTDPPSASRSAFRDTARRFTVRSS